MKILAFDTSNQTLAVGLLEDQKIIGQVQTTVNKNHSVTLMPSIESLMDQVGWSPQELDRIVVASGPGSYTGLRIGVTTAKTLAYTLQAELVGVNSLQVLAANCRLQPGVIVPLFDARRKNVYAAAYQWRGEALEVVLTPQHISLQDLLTALADQPEILFVGEDVGKFTAEITAGLPQAKLNQFPQWNYPNGIVLAELGQTLPVVKDVHGFLPTYLKKVEAEEKWLETHQAGDETYVEKI